MFLVIVCGINLRDNIFWVQWQHEILTRDPPCWMQLPPPPRNLFLLLSAAESPKPYFVEPLVAQHPWEAAFFWRTEWKYPIKKNHYSWLLCLSCQTKACQEAWKALLWWKANCMHFICQSIFRTLALLLPEMFHRCKKKISRWDSKCHLSN